MTNTIIANYAEELAAYLEQAGASDDGRHLAPTDAAFTAGALRLLEALARAGLSVADLLQFARAKAG